MVKLLIYLDGLFNYRRRSRIALRLATFTLLLIMAGACASAAWAQVTPSSTEDDAYTGLLAAAATWTLIKAPQIGMALRSPPREYSINARVRRRNGV